MLAVLKPIAVGVKVTVNVVLDPTGTVVLGALVGAFVINWIIDLAG